MQHEENFSAAKLPSMIPPAKKKLQENATHELLELALTISQNHKAIVSTSMLKQHSRDPKAVFSTRIVKYDQEKPRFRVGMQNRAQVAEDCFKTSHSSTKGSSLDQTGTKRRVRA